MNRATGGEAFDDRSDVDLGLALLGDVHVVGPVSRAHLDLGGFLADALAGLGHQARASTAVASHRSMFGDLRSSRRRLGGHPRPSSAQLGGGGRDLRATPGRCLGPALKRVEALDHEVEVLLVVEVGRLEAVAVADA